MTNKKNLNSLVIIRAPILCCSVYVPYAGPWSCRWRGWRRRRLSYVRDSPVANILNRTGIGLSIIENEAAAPFCRFVEHSVYISLAFPGLWIIGAICTTLAAHYRVITVLAGLA